jgi:hypothetical protein
MTSVRKISDDNTPFTEGNLGAEALRINRTGVVQNLSETAALVHAIPAHKHNNSRVGHYQVWRVFYGEEMNEVMDSRHIQFWFDE